MSKIKNNIWGIGFAVILIGAFGAMALASKNTKLPSPTAVAQDSVEFVITDQDHVLGAKDAKVTLIEYADFQCPACKAYYPWIENLVQDFPNDLRFVYRHFPLKQIHYQAQNSAEVAVAASLQGKFWEMEKALFENQEEWANTTGKEVFNKYATAIGLDMTKFASDLKLETTKEKVDADLEHGISIGINGTPTFYLNNKKIVNPQRYDDFKALIEEAIKSAPAN